MFLSYLILRLITSYWTAQVLKESKQLFFHLLLTLENVLNLPYLMTYNIILDCNTTAVHCTPRHCIYDGRQPTLANMSC